MWWENGRRAKEGRCPTSRSNLQHLREQQGPFLPLLGSFLTWMVRARDSAYLACRLSPHLLFFLSIGTSISPHLYFPLETASSVTPALGSSAGCRWVLLSPKASPQDIRGTATVCTKARGIQPMVTVPAAQRNPQSSTSACVHVSRMLKR